MKWYALNKEYVNYLKKYDDIVPNIEYAGKMKCFLGVLLKSNRGMEYFAPLTSYKPKFITMNNDIDFFKIVGKQGKIYGAIDINNMIPVPKNEYVEVLYENISQFREFKNDRERKSYWKLLKTELSCINEDILLNNAEKLYRFVEQYPNSPLAQRCCNYILLEEKCIEYDRVQNILHNLKNIDNKEDLYYIYDNLKDKEVFEDVALQLDKSKQDIQKMSISEINNILRTKIDIDSIEDNFHLDDIDITDDF